MSFIPRSPSAKTPKKRLQFDSVATELNGIFAEPTTPARKGIAAKPHVEASKATSEPTDAGVNSSLENSFGAPTASNTPQGPFLTNSGHTIMVTSATPPFASSTPAPEALHQLPMKKPHPSPSPKVCPPSPSPLRSTPYHKRQKNEIAPLNLFASEFMDDDSPKQASSLDSKHECLADTLQANLDLGPSVAWENADDEGANGNANPPKITYSSPPSTPPSSPPMMNYNMRAHNASLLPPPCNVNPFSPEKPKPTKEMLHEEYSPIVTSAHLARYEQDYEQLEMIGSGCFGSVYKVRDRTDGWVYAIKITKKKFRGQSDKQKLLQEVYALAALGTHSNVLRYYGAWIESDQLYIKTEFCGGGSLGSQFQSGAFYNEEKLCDILRQVASGLLHIHSRNFVHLDIKPENIYVSADGETCKIGDFGLLSNADVTRDFEEGDCRYLPKELLCEQVSEPTKADIFSLGCSVYELALRKPLPKGGEEWNMIREGQLSLPPTFSKEFIELLNQMMHIDPQQRPTAALLLQHPLLHTKPEKETESRKRKLIELQDIAEQQGKQIYHLQQQLLHYQQQESNVQSERHQLQALLFSLLKLQPPHP